MPMARQCEVLTCCAEASRRIACAYPDYHVREREDGPAFLEPPSHAFPQVSRAGLGVSRPMFDLDLLCSSEKTWG